MATVTERTVAVHGIDLHLAEAGSSSGPAVVLLHGFPDSWKPWRHQVDALAGVGMRVLPADDWAFFRRWAPGGVPGDSLIRPSARARLPI